MFCPCVSCVTVVGLYVLYIMWHRCCFSDFGKFWWEFGHFPCAPGTYAVVLVYSSSSWIRLIQSCSLFAKIWHPCRSHWHWVIPEFLLWFFLAKFPLIASTSMLSYLPLTTSPLPYISSFVEIIHELNYHYFYTRNCDKLPWELPLSSQRASRQHSVHEQTFPIWNSLSN